MLEYRVVWFIIEITPNGSVYMKRVMPSTKFHKDQCIVWNLPFIYWLNLLMKRFKYMLLN